MDILDGDMLTVGDIGQTGALGILVGALRVPLPANPELLPVVQAVAVDGSLATDGESVHAVGIDQCGEVFARLALNAGCHDGEVDDAVGAFQRGSLLQEQMRAGLEEQGTSHESSGGYHHHAPTLLGTAVDDGLNLSCLHLRTAGHHAIVGQHILSSQL